MHSDSEPQREQTHKPSAPSSPGSTQSAPLKPMENEVLNYLGSLAKDYHLPPKLVYAVADAESHLNPMVDPQPNYLKRNGKTVHDRQGNRIVRSWDYGLMQINNTAFGTTVKDPRGQKFKIGADVELDWQANARAGVALLAGAYDLAKLEQGPGATQEDHAQQAYPQYNGGKPERRDRYLKEKNGLPENDADRNFLLRYRKWTDNRR